MPAGCNDGSLAASDDNQGRSLAWNSDFADDEHDTNGTMSNFVDKSARFVAVGGNRLEGQRFEIAAVFETSIFHTIRVFNCEAWTSGPMSADGTEQSILMRLYIRIIYRYWSRTVSIQSYE